MVWAGELITMMKTSAQAGLFEKIKHVMLPVGAAMTCWKGLGQRWRIISGSPAGISSSISDTPQNKDWWLVSENAGTITGVRL